MARERQVFLIRYLQKDCTKIEKSYISTRSPHSAIYEIEKRFPGSAVLDIILIAAEFRAEHRTLPRLIIVEETEGQSWPDSDEE